jgi:hypothetical protein
VGTHAAWKSFGPDKKEIKTPSRTERKSPNPDAIDDTDERKEKYGVSEGSIGSVWVAGFC